MEIKVTDLVIGGCIITGVVFGTLFIFDGSTPTEDKPKVVAAESNFKLAELKRQQRKAKPQSINVSLDNPNIEQPMGNKDDKMEDSIPLEQLISMLKNQDPDLRIEAFWTIRYDPDAYEYKDVHPFLLKGVTDGNEDIREAAVQAAGEYTADPAVLQVYDKILEGKDVNNKLDTIQFLFNMNYTMQVEQALIFRLWDEDELVRESAMDILNQNNGERFENIEQAQKEYQNFRKGAL